ncbi:MAG: hypothetical protein ACJA0C_001188 [Candidatus Endobugula sp.]|jgi:hypothetical protein
MTSMMGKRHDNQNKIASFRKAFFAYPDKICRNRLEPYERAQRMKAREGFHHPVFSGSDWILGLLAMFQTLRCTCSLLGDRSPA